MKGIFSLGLVYILTTYISFSQLSTYSPYTRYGIGENASIGNGNKRALGGIGAGYRLRNNIDSDQPASYTAQDTMSFILDLSIDGRYINYQTEDLSQSRFNLYFNHFAIGFPITRWMKSSIGLRPYSYVGYNLMETYIDEENDIRLNYYFNGNGGLNEFYWGNAVEFNKKLSIGLNLKYLFGIIEQKNEIYSNLSESFFTNIETKYVIHNVILDYGIQYYNKFGDEIKYTIGLAHNPSFNIKYNYDSLTYNGNNTLIDTLLYSADNKSSFKLPQKIDAGVSVEYKEKLTVGFDFSRQDWTGNTFRNPNNYLSNSNAFKLGLAYIPNKYSVKRYFHHIQFRVGANYSKTNLTINNNNIINRGISFGLGLPFKNSGDLFNFAFEYGNRGTTNNSLIKETYFITTFNITLYDIWFFKRKFD